MKNFYLIALIATLVSCGKETADLTVKGNIKGLKKGTVYLKKLQDTAVITLDSFNINGSSGFELHSNMEAPEVLYLDLDKNSAENDRIAFFANKGITEINTTLKNFVFDAQINGSEQQKTLENYKSMISKFNDQNLNLIKESLEARKEADSTKLDSIERIYNNLLKRRYLYTVNFALNNKDSEVAPYLALTEIYDANIKLLDTINNSLTERVKTSKYGKELQTYISTIKTQADN
ncbi:MAG: DUF4369 domain-containing protein [Flavobacteriaceae bacterium]